VSGSLIQIGSYESEALANGAWSSFKARYGDVTGGLSENIQKTEIAGKGTYYRLRFGPFADRGAASEACFKLKAEGANCFVATP
jgi:cell division protein FtsN